MSDEPLSRLLAADVTLSGIEARRSDGLWVPVEGTLPKVVNALALADDGGSVTLPADLVPEGQYTALQVRVSKIELAQLPATALTVAPKGVGWTVMIPVDFGVVAGQSTGIALTLRLDRSIKPVGGGIDFEPDFEVLGVERD